MKSTNARSGTGMQPVFEKGNDAGTGKGSMDGKIGCRLGATPMQVALAWLLQRAPNVLVIPGTSSIAHLRENLAASRLTLSPETFAELDGIGVRQ